MPLMPLPGAQPGFHRALPQQTPTKLAYDGKDLEIMVKGIVHDDFARLLDHFITVTPRHVR